MKDDPLNRLKVRRGSQLPHSKLTEDDIRNIRELVEYRDKLKQELKGLTNKSLAEKFDVHQRTIEKAVAGESWGHV